MKYRLLVFDWDGTVIDSPAAIVKCIQDAARDMGLGVPDDERASHVIGLGLADSLTHAVPDLTRERYPEFVEAYRRHFRAREEHMPVFAGMKDLLMDMGRDTTLAIATGKSRRGLDRALEATGLKPLFAASRCADETHPKPHPAMLLELMAELAVGKRQTLMIGDTSHDLDMAQAAGVDALGVTYGAHPEDALKRCASLACFGSVGALHEWLKKNA